MTDELAGLRAEMEALDELGDTRLDISDTESVADVDPLFEAYYADRAESATFAASLDALSVITKWDTAPAGRAARSAGRSRGVTSQSVGETLSVAPVIARAALARVLGISREAADLLLDRPAASLLSFAPADVGLLSDEHGLARGRLFAAVADSSRADGDSVYAYRPGAPATEPAKRSHPSGDPYAALLAWGRALMERPRDG